MYLVIPLFLISGLVLGTLVIIARKFPYLKKLPVDAEQKTAGNFFWEFFPEWHLVYKKVDWAAYWGHLLREFEKFLRRLKVFSLKIETLSNTLIRKIKTNGYYQNGGSAANRVAVEAVKSAAEAVPIFPVEPIADYQKEEQSLIIEIAKDPKNPELYRRLGDVYLAMKNFLDAKDSLTTALKLDPEHEKTREKLARLQTLMPM